MYKTSLKKYSSYAYLFGVFLLAVSLPWSKFLMSNAQIILLASWLLGGDLPSKLIRFLKNKTALVLSSVFILHVIGLSYTTDFTYGLEDVQKKIPLLLLPLIFSTSAPLSKKMLENVLSFFVLSVITASLVCFYVLLGYTHKQILQPQQASVFISHIRFGLLISLSIFILAYFFFTKKILILKIIIPALMVWLILFLLMMESATGLVCTAVISVLLILYFIFTSKKIVVKLALIAILILPAAYFGNSYLSASKDVSKSLSETKQLPLLTKNGNSYSHDTISKETENGNYVWLNVCEKELADEWNKKSRIGYGEKDLQRNEIKYTLIRFLASKGLAKDSEGVNTLSEKEIQSIEKGIPNVNYIGLFNPKARVEKIIWEFNIFLKGGNPSGHSVIQRFEFWKASIGIIKKNILFGVGTGDADIAFADQYNKMNSPLTKEWRLRSHNQFLAIGVAFGIIGIMWFLISLFYPLIKERNYKDYLYVTFFIIAFLSMLTEDTLESQAGATFFAFFNSLFLFCREKTVVNPES
ncbi:MAG: O-antigen ligase family protein [Bacteroidetes bacterium]|nr:O-antigen ligase family protein [Bacteroidota bacterium]